MPLSSVVQRQHHIAALLFQDRKYHHGFHAYLFNFLRVRLTHTVRRYHQWLLCMEKRFLGNPASLVKIRDQSRCQPFTDDIHRIRVCLQLKNLCAVYLNVLCQNLQPSAHSQFDLIITVQKLDDLRSSLYRMEIAAHLFLRISAPSALGFRAETGHTVSVDICTGIPQQIQNLVKRYGNLVALNHLNLDIHEGEIFGLLGPNGSGKTTAINCLLSLLKYDKGTIEVFGQPMTPESYQVKQQIGIVLQNVAVFDELTVYENIDYFCGLYVSDKKRRKELVNEAIQFVGLEDYCKTRPGKLSGGLLRRLNIACGIAHKPRLIIMDEPTVAVDPQSRNKILEGIQKLNEQGSTIIYTSHYMEEVEQICTRIAIMDHGRVIASGTTEELKKMIKTGETITVEAILLEEKHLQDIRNLSHVFDVHYENQILSLRCTGAQHNLIRLLNYLQSQDITFGRVFSELPTLNDVFLEITGKQLRD